MIKAEHKAELQFSVSAIKGILSKGSAVEITDELAVAITAATEYLISEILELSGNTTRDNRRIRITTEFINIAIEKDNELKQTFKMMPIIVDDNLLTFRAQTSKVLKLVHPHTSITGEAAKHMDAIIHTFIEDCSIQIKQGVTDISDMMHTILYGTLATHAAAEANKAVQKYKTWTPSTAPTD
jgi:hypothetical protein